MFVSVLALPPLIPPLGWWWTNIPVV